MRLPSKDYLFVTVQLILLVMYCFDFLPPFKTPKFFMYLGLLFSIVGFLVSVMAVFKLDKNLTVFPTPKNNSELITSGLYQFCRHPIYSGIISFVFGYAVFKASSFKLIMASLLLLWFFLKSIYEEKRLQEKYPDYKSYKEKVGRFFPKLKF